MAIWSSKYCAFISAIGILGLVSCADSADSPFPIARSESGSVSIRSGVPVGTIAVIHRTHHFVLLDMSFPIASGTLLRCGSGSQQTALLRVSSPSHYPFLIADIVQGEPAPGEQVFSVVNTPTGVALGPPHNTRHSHRKKTE